MKNVLVANFRENNLKYNLDSLFTLVRAQIENSLELGWKPEDIILLSNKEFEYIGVKTLVAPLNNFCFTGSKMFAVKYLFEQGLDDVIFVHDLEAWQDVWFVCPEFNDVGITQYSRPKINGGVIFWKLSAKDIVNEIVEILSANNANKEEPTLNRVIRKYQDRATVLNSSYNCGCSGYVPRYLRSDKPVKIFHFHPTNTIAWETHVLDRSGIGGRISNRLEMLLRKYYPNLSGELSDKGKKRREQKIMERLKKEEENEKENSKGIREN